MVDLEHDKSNLSLFVLVRSGERVAQIADMSNIKTLADLDEKTSSSTQLKETSGQRVGSSGDTPVKTAPAAAAADKRKWKRIKVKGQEVSMIAGDRNADSETARARAEAGDDRDWEELEVEGDKVEGVFGDVNELPNNATAVMQQ